MAMLLGKKVGITQVYDEQGNMVPVSVIKAGPCVIMQVKTPETDGYKAIQIGFNDVKPSRRLNPAIGHAKKANAVPKSFVREMRLSDDSKEEFKAGDSLSVSVFAQEKLVDIIGTSKGKGFAGPMKRYHFGGMPASHGTERKHRSPGSQAGYGTDRGHGGNIKKGKRMGGHMGHVHITSKNHVLVNIDEANNLLVVKGSIPGPVDGYCVIRSAKKPVSKK
jgi:large subunit ribosomal protein L3